MLPPPLGVAALFNASAGWLAATCCGCGFCARCCFDRAFLAWHFARLTSTCASCRHGAAGWVRQGGDNRHKGGRLTEALRFSCSRNIGRCRRRACEVLMPQSREGGRGRVTAHTERSTERTLRCGHTRRVVSPHRRVGVACCPLPCPEREREGGRWLAAVGGEGGGGVYGRVALWVETRTMGRPNSPVRLLRPLLL
jgi:hypothetical protein